MPVAPSNVRLLLSAVALGALLSGSQVRAGHPEPASAADNDPSRPVSFELDVLPILTAAGCNAGACHGKARGQNGFQLSLLAFDAEADYVALTQEARGRRVFLAAPEQSLLLRKPTAAVPHGGGQRLKPGDADYQTILHWIASGVPRRIQNEPHLEAIAVNATSYSLKPQQQQSLLVQAHYSDGSQRDVTQLTSFQSSEAAVADIDATGTIQAGPLPGEATMMARYMGQITTCHVTIPLPGEVPQQVYDQLPEHNFIDALVWEKLQTLGITPSPAADDATFLRRAFIDIIGRVPSADEVRSFVADGDPDKRERLIDQLLERPEYADRWATIWADLLRPNPYRVGIKAVLNYDNWIRESFRQNKPYDEFVRELITAQGSTWHNGAVTLYRDRRSPEEVATLVSQLFLGTRLECARCHHHPFEKWSQEDFYRFAAFFARVDYKGTGLSPPISGGEEVVMTGEEGVVKHPLTGEPLEPRVLVGSTPSLEEVDDPRQVLAEWMTAAENRFFTQTIVNRVWAELMGRGIVEPIDDLRATNPASNPALLEQLAEEFRRSDHDLKALIRTITLSYVYGLSSEPSERNVSDTRDYSRHYRQRLPAEVLADAVDDITGVRDDYEAAPPGTRASQLWTRRIDSLFLDTFGRPDPNQDPPCERTSESTVTQALHLMNAPRLHAKITSDKGRAAELAASDLASEQIVEQLYLLVYGRFPNHDERQLGSQLFEEPEMSRRQATEDLMWALLNTPEFMFEN